MIYFIRHGKDGPIKIGYTGSDGDVFHYRLSAMQVSSPVGLIPLGIMSGDLEKEKDLHRAFSEDRIRGEWFNPSDGLLAYISLNTVQPKPPGLKSNTEQKKQTIVLRVRIDEEVVTQLEQHARELKTTLPQVVRWVLGDAAQKQAAELLPLQPGESSA